MQPFIAPKGDGDRINPLCAAVDQNPLLLLSGWPSPGWPFYVDIALAVKVARPASATVIRSNFGAFQEEIDEVVPQKKSTVAHLTNKARIETKLGVFLTKSGGILTNFHFEKLGNLSLISNRNLVIILRKSEASIGSKYLIHPVSWQNIIR